jgi:hypothetical protein
MERSAIASRFYFSIAIEPLVNPRCAKSLGLTRAGTRIESLTLAKTKDIEVVQSSPRYHGTMGECTRVGL